MKKKILVYLLAAVAAVAALSSCKKDSKPQSVAGEWELTDVDLATRSAVIGSETVTVYLNLAEDGTFALYQIIGDGRSVSFTGTWQQSGDIMSGSYSDGTAWSTSYEVSVSNGKLTMTTEDGKDMFIYKSCSIPYDKL